VILQQEENLQEFWFSFDSIHVAISTFKSSIKEAANSNLDLRSLAKIYH